MYKVHTYSSMHRLQQCVSVGVFFKEVHGCVWVRKTVHNKLLSSKSKIQNNTYIVIVWLSIYAAKKGKENLHMWECVCARVCFQRDKKKRCHMMFTIFFPLHLHHKERWSWLIFQGSCKILLCFAESEKLKRKKNDWLLKNYTRERWKEKTRWLGCNELGGKLRKLGVRKEWILKAIIPIGVNNIDNKDLGKEVFDKNSVMHWECFPLLDIFVQHWSKIHITVSYFLGL